MPELFLLFRKKMKPNSVIKKIRILKVWQREKEFGGNKNCFEKREESRGEKREAGLMLLPQSASRGRCFHLGCAWLSLVDSKAHVWASAGECPQAVLVPAVGGASLSGQKSVFPLFFPSLCTAGR